MKSTLKIISAMVIWGSIGIFVKNIDLPSIETAFLRAIIASIFLSVVFFFTKNDFDKLIFKKNLKLLIAAGISIGLNWVLLFQAYQYTTISNATLSYYLAPVIVIILSPFILGEKLNLSKIIAVACALVGLFLILLNQGSENIGTYQHIKGIAYGLSAACLYATVILLNKHIKDVSNFITTITQIFFAGLVLLPFVVYRSNISFSGQENWGLIVFLGIIHTGVAYLLYFSGLKDIKAQNVAIYSYLDPISAVLFGTIFMHEVLTLWQIVGGILILCSTLFSDMKNIKVQVVEKAM